MAEVSFAKAFLSALDAKPVKLRADHVFDPEQVGLRVPFLLPRLQSPHPSMPKKVKSTAAPGSSRSTTIRLKSSRNPTLEFTLPNAPLLTTSVEDLRTAVCDRVLDAQDNKVALEKIKILYKRKPVSRKTISELLADEPGILAGGKEIEIGVMIMGGAKVVEPTVTGAEKETDTTNNQSVPKPAVGPSGEDVVKTDEFWDDLQGFLSQRIKDLEEAKKLRTLFHGAWTSR